MSVKILILIGLLFTVVTSRSVKFSVVAFGKSVSVDVAGTKYSLKKYSTYAPVYQATISVKDEEVKYEKKKKIK